MSAKSKGVTDLQADVLEAAQRIWFAGLGAMALAQEEGARVVGGTAKLFSLLVEKGQEMEQGMERAGVEAVDRAKGAVGSAEDAWAKVQKLVDAQVAAALHRIGVPTKDEIGELSQRIEQLTASIEALKVRT